RLTQGRDVIDVDVQSQLESSSLAALPARLFAALRETLTTGGGTPPPLRSPDIRPRTTRTPPRARRRSPRPCPRSGPPPCPRPGRAPRVGCRCGGPARGRRRRDRARTSR